MEIQKHPQYTLLVGNAGVGKSTLLNGVVKEAKFESGLSFGTGKTQHLQLCEHPPQSKEYWGDTPGLDDIDKRKEAAQEIEKGMKQNGKYRIVFVVQLREGRVLPADCLMIRIVLKAISKRIPFVVVINRISKEELKCMANSNEIVEKMHLALIPKDRTLDAFTINLPEEQMLKSKRNVVPSESFIKPLNKLLAELPFEQLSPQQVGPILSQSSFDKLLEEMNQHLSEIYSTTEIRLRYLKDQLQMVEEDCLDLSKHIEHQSKEISSYHENGLVPSIRGHFFKNPTACLEKHVFRLNKEESRRKEQKKLEQLAPKNLAPNFSMKYGHLKIPEPTEEKHVITNTSRTGIIKYAKIGESEVVCKILPEQNALIELHAINELKNSGSIPYFFGWYQPHDVNLKKQLSGLHFKNMTRLCGLAMERSSYGSLDNYLRLLDPPLEECYELAFSLCECICIIHELGVVHGDIAARNVLVFMESESYKLKLCDFGLSVVLQDSKKTPISRDALPLAWCAPEVQFGETSFSLKADIWSLGITRNTLSLSFY